MFKEILLPVDLGDPDSSKKALSVAVELSQGAGARLHVLTVVPGFGMSIISQYFPEDFEEKSQADAAQQLNDYIGANIPSDIATQAIVANGTIYEEILRVAAETGCDLIVVASHRPALKDYLLGPNAARVVRHATCSVLVVRD
ncbi:MAG: universal stress protein [Proteobacteria bacterium]|nr:universal stress protein [Pseudomonadota bacterium]